MVSQYIALVSLFLASTYRPCRIILMLVHHQRIPDKVPKIGTYAVVKWFQIDFGVRRWWSVVCDCVLKLFGIIKKRPDKRLLERRTRR